MSDAHQREAAIFDAAIELPPEQRAAYLEQACGGDAALRRRIECLLQADQSRCEFLDPPDGPVQRRSNPLTAALSEKPGEMIDRYKLLQKIGEGGCGVVYMAEQTQPVHRRVALKIIKLGMDTKSVVARFEAERQALAMMDHPNIAKVLDAGATETGRPYFVMELVRGIRITDYCDERKLSTNDRLNLFIQVCHAIQHAHQKGIIHRDIKPSNILVTVNDGEAVPKVIDFGVAKATSGQQLTDKTLFTAFEQFIGTPAYMSPEQAVLTSLDIDTRSDIYALGVLLYELMTGRPPFDPKELLAVGLDEMRRTIREKEPELPSTRVGTLPSEELSTMSHRRGLTSPKLASELRGDLDWIVMKALEKDRARRYETANGMAMDIERHLKDEPVVARPPSKLYEFQKTVKRHKVGFAATAAIILVLAAGVAVSTWQASRAGREATRATAALDELRETAPAFVTQARALVASERFDEAIEKLDYAIKLRPDVAEYRAKKGDLLMSQIKLAEAATLYREALRLEPGLAQAEESAQLCNEVLAAKPADDGGPSRESLARLLTTMQQQQRPAAELIPVARRLGEEKQMVLDLWLEKLKDLPIPPDKPLKDRLKMAEDVGRLTLDLSGTSVSDLEPLRGMPVGWLSLSGCSGIRSLEPLRDAPLRTLILDGLSSLGEDDFSVISSLTHLKVFSAQSTGMANLSPLRGLPLLQVFLTDTKIQDLTPLQGMKLTHLQLRGTRVYDLSSLAGMPLALLDTTGIPAVDYSPLKGAPLEECNIQFSPIRDLSFLGESPVQDLTLNGCNLARGYEVLEGLKSLRALVLPATYRELPAEELAALERLRNSPTLKSIDTAEGRGDGWLGTTARSADAFWKAWDGERALIASLKESGFRYEIRMHPSGKYVVAIGNQPLRDISFLKDAPIDGLNLYGTEVSDLSPLENLPLLGLDIRRTPVSDLSPLRSPVLSASLKELGMSRIPATDFSPISACVNLEGFDASDTALESLDVVRACKLRSAWLSGTKISDISALAGMPLESVFLARTSVTDIRPLLQCPSLKNLVLPPEALDVEALHALPKLGHLSFFDNKGEVTQTAREFWAEYRNGGLTPESVSILSEQAVENPEDGLLAMKVAALQAWFGLDAEYGATCMRRIEEAEQAPETKDVREQAARNWCLVPSDDEAMSARVLALAREAVEAEVNKGQLPWYHQALGMAQFRAGDCEAAEESFLRAESLAEANNWTPRLRVYVQGPSQLYRAIMLARQGNMEEAKELFLHAERMMPPLPGKAAEVLPTTVTQDDLLYWLAHREASALIEPPAETTAEAR